MNKTVTSSAVVFDNIPVEEPFLTGRPDHWISPAPRIDDVGHEENETSEEIEPNDDTESGSSCFDGRDIPRTQRGRSFVDLLGDRLPVRKEETEEEESKASGEQKDYGKDFLKKWIQGEYATNPNNENGFEDPAEENNSTLCMLVDSSISMEDVMNGHEANDWKRAIALEDKGLEELNVISKEEPTYVEVSS